MTKKVLFVVLAVLVAVGLFGCAPAPSNVTLDQVKSSLGKAGIDTGDFAVTEASDKSYTFAATVTSYTQDIVISGTLDKNKNLTTIKIENHGVDVSKYFENQDSVTALLEKSKDAGSLTVKDLKALFSFIEMEQLYALCANAKDDASLSVAQSSMTSAQPVEENKWKFSVTKSDGDDLVVVEADYLGK